jgi:hypothetical protein
VIELADVFRRFADGYLSAHGAAMPASHRRAIADILACENGRRGGVGSSALKGAFRQFSWVKHLPPALLIRLQRPLASSRGSGPTCAA